MATGSRTRFRCWSSSILHTGNGRWSQPKSQKSPLFSVPFVYTRHPDILKMRVLYKTKWHEKKTTPKTLFRACPVVTLFAISVYRIYIYICTYYRIYCPPLVEFLAHLNMYHRIINIISIVSHIYIYIHMICIIFPTGLIPVTKKKMHPNYPLNFKQVAAMQVGYRRSRHEPCMAPRLPSLQHSDAWHLWLASASRLPKDLMYLLLADQMFFVRKLSVGQNGCHQGGCFRILQRI